MKLTTHTNLGVVTCHVTRSSIKVIEINEFKTSIVMSPSAFGKEFEPKSFTLYTNSGTKQSLIIDGHGEHNYREWSYRIDNKDGTVIADPEYKIDANFEDAILFFVSKAMSINASWVKKKA